MKLYHVFVGTNQAASRASEMNSTYTFDTMSPQIMNSSIIAFFHSKPEADHSTWYILTEVKLWIWLARTIPLTLGRALAHNDNRVISVPYYIKEGGTFKNITARILGELKSCGQEYRGI